LTFVNTPIEALPYRSWVPTDAARMRPAAAAMTIDKHPLPAPDTRDDADHLMGLLRNGTLKPLRLGE
jgi:hypothetical protein